MPDDTVARDAKWPRLSVVLPNYNHAHYLPRALDALLAEGGMADEIIVVDDRSTDESMDLIRRYAEKHPSIRYLQNDTNLGAIATLERGLRAARGTLIYFGAADDFVMPGFFASALKAFDACPQAGMVCGEMIVMNGETGQPLGLRPPVRPKLRGGYIAPHKFRELLKSDDNYILTGAAIINREAVIAAGGFDEGLFSFADGYMVRKVALTHGLYYLPQPLLTWCIFPDSVSRKSSTESGLIKAVLAAAVERMAHDKTFPPWYPDAFSRRWRFSTSRLAVQESPVNREVLNEIGARNQTDRNLFAWLLDNLGEKPARFLILSWLWLRFRPFSPFNLLTTALMRKLERTRRGSDAPDSSQHIPPAI